MKPFVSVLIFLCFCLSKTQSNSDGISSNDITQQLHYDHEENRMNEVEIQNQRSEAATPPSTEQTCQPDIHSILREMTAMLTEQRVELTHTKTEISSMETRLRDSERHVEQLKTVVLELEKKDQEQLLNLSILANNLEATERQLEEQKMVIEQLMREKTSEKVAFSASLGGPDGYTGPYNVEVTLIYRNVFTNIGNAYNPDTGFFQAPVKGVYEFTFSVTSWGSENPVGARLFKNGHHVVIAYCIHKHDMMSTTNGASLLLEVGDVVCVKLYPNTRVWDNGNRYNTFRGDLLFTM